MRLFYVLLIVFFASCNGTYYITSTDHKAHHPNCSACSHHVQWNTNYVVVKPYRPNYHHKPHKPHHNKPRRKRR